MKDGEYCVISYLFPYSREASIKLTDSAPDGSLVWGDSIPQSDLTDIEAWKNRGILMAHAMQRGVKKNTSWGRDDQDQEAEAAKKDLGEEAPTRRDFQVEEDGSDHH